MIRNYVPKKVRPWSLWRRFRVWAQNNLDDETYSLRVNSNGSLGAVYYFNSAVKGDIVAFLNSQFVPRGYRYRDNSASGVFYIRYAPGLTNANLIPPVVPPNG